MRLLWHVQRLSQQGCGMSRRVRSLASSLARRHELRLLAPADAVEFDAARLDGVPIDRVPVPSDRPLHWSLQAGARRRRAARIAKDAVGPVDALLTCQPEFAEAAARNHPGRPVALVACCSQLLFEHLEQERERAVPWPGRAAFVLNRRLLRRNERIGFRAAHAIAFDSHMTRRIASRRHGLPAERCHVMTPTVDVERFRPAEPAQRDALRREFGLAPEDFAACWCGRMAPGKNVELLLEAAARLPRLTVLLAGEGEEQPRLERMTAELNLTDRVRFLGMQPETVPALQAADVFVFPSRAESFGIVVIEAMACGLPCIALTDPSGQFLCGATEAIAHGETGWVLANDSPSLLAESLEQLRSRPAGRIAMGRAGRARAVSEYALGRDAAQLEAILESIT